MNNLCISYFNTAEHSKKFLEIFKVIIDFPLDKYGVQSDDSLHVYCTFIKYLYESKLCNKKNIFFLYTIIFQDFKLIKWLLHLIMLLKSWLSLNTFFNTIS